MGCACWLSIVPDLNMHAALFTVTSSIFSIPYTLMYYSMCPHLPLSMEDWLWGTPITNSDGTKVLFTTDCSHAYCNCQPWYTDSRAECRFTVSQDLARRDQQCTCNRKGVYKIFGQLYTNVHTYTNKPLFCNLHCVVVGVFIYM